MLLRQGRQNKTVRFQTFLAGNHTVLFCFRNSEKAADKPHDYAKQNTKQQHGNPRKIHPHVPAFVAHIAGQIAEPVQLIAEKPDQQANYG